MMEFKTREERGENNLGHGSHGQSFGFYSDKDWKSLEDSEAQTGMIVLTVLKDHCSCCLETRFLMGISQEAIAIGQARNNGSLGYSGAVEVVRSG